MKTERSTKSGLKAPIPALLALAFLVLALGFFGADPDPARPDAGAYRKALFFVGLGMALGGGLFGLFCLFTGRMRKRLELSRAELRESEARFRALVESSSDWVWEVDAQAAYTYVSPKVHELLGYTPEEVIGKTPFDLMPPDEAERVRALFNGFAAAGRPAYGIENTNCHKDGRLVVLETSAVPIFDTAGALTGYRGMDRDITERKRIEVALCQSQESLAESQRIARLGSWDWDIVQGELRWSDELYRIFGLPPEGFGATYAAFLQVVHPDDRARVEQAVDAALTGEEPYDIEHRIVRPDGSERVLRERGEVRLDTGGRPVRMLGTAQDVTEQKLAELQLRQAAKVFENTSEGVIITGPDHRIVAVNRAFTRITGYREEEVTGRKPDILRSGRHDAAYYRQIASAIRASGHWQGEIWNRRKDGADFPGWLSVSAVRDEAGAITNYIGVFSDITLIKAAQDELEYAVHHDVLTRLPNPLLFRDRLEQALAMARRTGTGVALFSVDLDRFKLINDTLGREAGDLLLQAVAQRLVGCVREEDTVARLGGDEFVVMVDDLSTDPEAAAYKSRALGEKVLNMLREPFQIAGHQHFATPSIGVTAFNGDQSDVSELLKQADLAMYQAKGLGRNTLCYFDPDMQATVSANAAVGAALRVGLREKQFVVHYQPQVDRQGVITGVEALVRWQHPEKGLVKPADFIPVAEDTGLILPLGMWVLETACEQLAAWADWPQTASLSIAVNVSVYQFRHPNFVDMVMASIARTGIRPHKLKLELTESLLADRMEITIQKMGMLKDLGVTLSLDDFGVGYSSLSCLKRLPLDQLKIDKGFVADVLTDPNDAAISRAIIALAQSLSLQVVAEGVETHEQRDFLAYQGCDQFQGHLFAPALPIETLDAFLRNPSSGMMVAG